jgi:hypothetical protein
MDCMVDAHERLFTALTGAGPGSPNPLGEDLTAAGEC